MNAKDIKKYTLINEIVNSNPDDNKIGGLFSELISIDFATAFEVWEFKLYTHQDQLEDYLISQNLETKIFTLFNTVNEIKTRQLFTESLPLNKYVYSCCATSCSDTNLYFLVNLILSAKIEAAEEILRCAKANKIAKFEYSDAIRRVVETVFAEYCLRNDVKKCQLNRKQSNLLLEFVSKAKGPNKPLLTQWIKEL